VKEVRSFSLSEERLGGEAPRRRPQREVNRERRERICSKSRELFWMWGHGTSESAEVELTHPAGRKREKNRGGNNGGISKVSGKTPARTEAHQRGLKAGAGETLLKDRGNESERSLKVTEERIKILS